MTPENISAGLSQVEEIRAALERFRKSGKPVIAYCENFSNASYYLASVADKIILDPASESMITGVGSQMIFLKDLLDALGVDVQLIRHGKYKSAGEMFVRSSASPENRLQNEVLINSLWNTMSSQIAASRGFSQEELDGWVENLEMCHPDEYKTKGLIDEIWYKDEVDKYLCEQNGVRRIQEVGFVKINKYAAKIKKGSRKNKIAVIYADGEIVNSGSDADIVGSKLANTIRKVREDKKVKAVVFRVNSPGGSAQASEAIRHELELLRAEKPVIASYGDYAASGGYWISAQSDFIFSDESTITGSIGVFGMVPDFSKTASDVLHVGVETVSSNKHGAMYSLVKPFDQAEYNYMLRSIEDIYDRFTSLVADGRDMAKERVDEIGQGRVWTGADALEIGLVDQIGTLDDAVAYAAELAGDPTLANWNVKAYPAPPTTIETLMNSMGGNQEDYSIKAIYQKIKEPRIVARLPYEITILN